MARWAKQSIVVHKTSGLTRDKAKEIARPYADRLYTARETGESFRFRQLPPSKFERGSFRTKHMSGRVAIIEGKLK
jgi:hypothetical protein